MGVAIILRSADFSAKNLGKVTFLQDVDVESIAINGSDSVAGRNSTYTTVYTPYTTNQKGVTWSITSGNEYATIDANTGVLTILEGASSSSVTIQAVSTFNSTIIASKIITVTYVDTVDELNSISLTNDVANKNSIQFNVIYNPTNTSKKGVTWSITSGNEYATIDTNTGVLTILEGASGNNVTVKAISTADSLIFATRDVTVTYQAANVLYNMASPFVTTGPNPRSVLETNIPLFDSNKDFTIIFSTKANESGSAGRIWTGGYPEGSYGWNNIPIISLTKDIWIGAANSYDLKFAISYKNVMSTLANITLSDESGKVTKVAIVKLGNTLTLYVNQTGKTSESISCEISEPVSNYTVMFGGLKNETGAIIHASSFASNYLTIYEAAMTEQEVVEKFNKLV